MIDKDKQWKKVKLGELITYVARGITPKYSDEKELMVINQRCIRDYELQLDNVRYHSVKAKKVNEEKILKKYDILINSTGVGTLGRVCQNFFDSLKMTVDSHVTILRPDFTKVDPIFLGYILKWKQPVIEQLGEGTTGQTELKRERLINELEFYYPNDRIIEKTIAKILISLDEKIRINNEINNNLEKLLQLIFKSWFVNFERFNGKKPLHWTKGKLKDILMQNKISIKKENIKNLPYLPIDVIPINSLSIKEFKSNLEAKSSLIKFSENDILIGAMRVYFHRVVISPCEGITRNTCFVLSPYKEEYLAYSLCLCNQKDTINYAQNTSKGTTMPYAIWENGLANMTIDIPDLKTVTKFNELTYPILEKLKISYFENKCLKNTKEILLHKLLSGDIDVSKIKL